MLSFLRMTTTRVNESIFTSGIISQKKKQKLGVASVVSLTDEVPRKKRIPGEIVFPLNTDFRNPPERIIEILHVIDMQIRNGYAPILVHCEHGHDRSPAVVATYLYCKGDFSSFDRALEHIKSMNPKIKPKKEFVSFIKDEALPLLETSKQKPPPPARGKDGGFG